jgi:hypothetical protein
MRDKKPFYREQAEKFLDFAKKSPERDLLSLFDEWTESKDFSDEDRQRTFAQVIILLPKNKQILIPKLNIHLRHDPIALRDIIKIILLAIELGEKEEGNNKELDNQ